MFDAIDREALLAVLGLLHFLQLPSTAFLARGTLKLKRELKWLSALNQRIVLVFVAAVSFLLLGLGALLAWRAHAFATTLLGYWLCALLSAFWSARAAAQLWLFSVWPRGQGARRWYWGLFCLYLSLAGGYWLVTLTATQSQAHCDPPRRIIARTFKGSAPICVESQA
jgi:hypothetical protein